jgi:hypothetical protein
MKSTMPKRNLDQPATAMWIPTADLRPQAGARFRSGERRFDTTRQAIIFIMRELSPSYRGTAWIATDSGDIQIDEIEQLYRQVNPRTRSSGKP